MTILIAYLVAGNSACGEAWLRTVLIAGEPVLWRYYLAIGGGLDGMRKSKLCAWRRIAPRIVP